MSRAPPHFENFVFLGELSEPEDQLRTKILSGELKAHIYSTLARGDFEPVPITAAEFSIAEDDGWESFSDPDPQAPPFQIMVRDRDRRRRSDIRRAIRVPHWIYVQAATAARLQKPARRGPGAPRKYDWPEIKRFTFEQLNTRGDFAEEDQVDDWKTYADLYRAIAEKFGGKCPELTTLKENVPGFVDDWRELKVGNSQ